MARGRPARGVAGREYVDRSARQSPARLALGVFAAVVAVFTGLLSLPCATRRAGSAHRSSTRCSPRPRRHASPGWSSCPPATYWSTARARRHPRRHPDRRPRRHDARVAARPGRVPPHRADPAAARLVGDEDRPGSARSARCSGPSSSRRSALEVAIALVLCPAVPDARRGLGRGRLARRLLRDLGVQQRGLRPDRGGPRRRTCPTGGCCCRSSSACSSARSASP